MKRALIFLAGISSLATASTDYTADSRKLSASALCGATNTTCQQAYISGAKDGTAAFKRVLVTYKAIRAAEVPTPPPPPPAPPPSPPPPSGEVLHPIAAIPSNFDVASELVPAWGTGAIPPSAAPDVVGAFRFICNASHLAYDDPIVYPGQPGKSHLHQFYGNSGANANSTFASLRTSGNSTCNSPLNRSAYWMPGMLDGLGNVVIPDYVQVYYKRRMRTDPRCTLGNANAEGDCVNLPNGLRFIFGYDMATMTKGNGAPYYDCQGPTATPGHYYANQNGLATVATKCGPGNLLGAVIAGPDCWDGVHLDVPDHRSHMAYKVKNQATGQFACPATHPKVIPQFTISAWYKVEPVAGVQYPVQNWSLSSDAMPGMTMAQGSTLHFDYFEGWDEAIKKAWHDACIDGLKNASGGDICDGRQLKMFAGFKWAASPNRVPIPVRP